MSDALVEIMDVMPTIMDFADVNVPDYVEGRSLLPILTGRANADHHRDAVRCEYFDAAMRALDLGPDRVGLK